MMPLGSRNIVKQVDKLLTNKVLMEGREILDGAENNGIGEDGGIKRMGSKDG